MNVKISELNKRIQLVKIENIVNKNGVDEDKEVVIASVWAKAQNISGTEIFKARKDYSKVTTRFIIRYREDITSNYFIKLNGCKFNILYVNNYNYSNEFLEIIGEMVV